MSFGETVSDFEHFHNLYDMSLTLQQSCVMQQELLTDFGNQYVQQLCIMEEKTAEDFTLHSENLVLQSLPSAWPTLLILAKIFLRHLD